MPIEMGEEPDIYKIFCIAPIIRGFFVVDFECFLTYLGDCKMKKSLLCLFILSSVAMAENGKQVLDKERFDKDIAYYNAHKKDAQAIVTLLSQFNRDNDGVREAFEGYVSGNVEKWRKTVDKLNSARQYQNNLEAFSYFAGCRSASIFADLMWSAAPSNFNDIDEWKNPNSPKVKQFKQAKKSFQAEYMACKQSLTAPQEKDYYREDVERVGSWELNSGK